jgi:ssDNA-binding replication factor A large subunit
MDGNYEKILDRISRLSGVEKDELELRVGMKRDKLSGLISREGALQIIAAELGVSFDNEKLKINELLPGMRKVNVSGKIIFLSPVRTFKTKSGDEGKVVNLILADETSNIKVVLWDTNHIGLIEKGDIFEGSAVEIFGGSMRDSEVHLGSFSEIKPINDNFENVKVERVIKEKSINSFKLGESAKVRAFIVQLFDPRFFEVNKSTGRKMTEEERASGVTPEKRGILNIVIDDGTENIRAVMFHEVIKQLGLTELENQPLFEQQKENLFGKEMIFSGSVRRNTYFDNLEFIVDKVEEPDLDALIVKLE